MADLIRIDLLPTTNLHSLEHEFPAMKEGLTVKLTLAQVRSLMTTGSDPAVALALQNLDNTTGPRGKMGLGVPNTTNYNSLAENGVWIVAAGGTNAPEATRTYVVQVETGTHASGYLTQIARGFSAGVDAISWRRERRDGVWSSWSRIRETETELDARYLTGQVVFMIDNTVRSTNSTTYVATGVSASITPRRTGAKIIGQVALQLGPSFTVIDFTILRNSTALTPGGKSGLLVVRPSSDAADILRSESFMFEDNLSTLDPVTYHLHWKLGSAAAVTYLGRRNSDNSLAAPSATMLLQEI